jgi:FtsP/CotA-like multicopper oxidase with cupredoxin domain
MPMPTLTFTEGDTAEIVVHNAMEKEETSLHWHGLILPYELDGVPYLTTAPIKAGETQVYKFPLLQSGTYWYHSHTKLQEQNGMHGALIIHKRHAEPMPEQVLILSEWTDMKPFEVHRRLHSANDWSAIKKHRIRPGTVQSYSDAIKDGALGVKLTNEWKRMNAMDVSDVYYDLLFANGKPVDEAPQFKAGERVRVRLINGGREQLLLDHLCRREDDRGGQRWHRRGTRGGGPLHHGHRRDLRHHRHHSGGQHGL